jgi:hypothetical protein
MAASRRKDAPGNIRAGRFVLSQRTNIISDEESDLDKIPRSARILLIKSHREALVIVDPRRESRLNNLRYKASILSFC